jgi:transcription elongation factor GreA
METVPISPAGFDERVRELELLRDVRRREVAEQIALARQDGDVDDNPGLHALLVEQAQVEQRIGLLEAHLAFVEIVRPSLNGEAGIGSTIRIRDDRGRQVEYELVGPLEADVSSGRVSTNAPVGRALLGRRVGDRVEVETPQGAVVLEIVALTSRPRRRAA